MCFIALILKTIIIFVTNQPKKTIKMKDLKTYLEEAIPNKEIEYSSTARRIRVSIVSNEAPKLMSIIPLSKADMGMLEDYDEPMDQFNALCDCGDNPVSEFIFIHPYGSSELVVTDEDETEEYYCDDEYEICPNYGLMSMEEAEDNYDDDDEELRSYKVFLNAEFGDDHNRELNKGIKTVWEGLKINDIDQSTFVPEVIKYIISDAGTDKAFAQAFVCDYIKMGFLIDIPEDEEFDPSKLDFINIDQEYEGRTEILSSLLAEDLILLNAIKYDGKLYFADGWDDYEANGAYMHYDQINQDCESLD